jgi:catechol 2,3-dioxygenase-like lactoylglutathione lyase family enzyme
MNLNQVTLPAVDVAAAAAFYQCLGLRLIVDALPRYVRFECPEGDCTLSLEQVPGRGVESGPVVFFECQRLDETVGRLRAAGILFDTVPTDQPCLARDLVARPGGEPTLSVLGGVESPISAVASEGGPPCERMQVGSSMPGRQPARRRLS